MIAEISLILAVISGIIAIYTLVEARKIPDMVLDTLEEQLKETLEPMQKAVSKSMSNKGTAGAQVKQLQAMDRRIADDIMNMQDPMIQAGLELFPNVKEYIQKNPHLLPQLIPRLQALQGIEGFKLGDLTGKSLSPSSKSTPHPFGMREE